MVIICFGNLVWVLFELGLVWCLLLLFESVILVDLCLCIIFSGL